MFYDIFIFFYSMARYHFVAGTSVSWAGPFPSHGPSDQEQHRWCRPQARLKLPA